MLRHPFFTKIKFFTRKKIIKIPFLILLGSFFLFILLNVIFPLKINISYSQTITDAQGEVLQIFLSQDDKWRLKAELSEIIPDLKKAIIYKEDKYFYYHFGINPIAIAKALFNNTLAAKKTSGASTITMQVARMLVPKSRTYANKLVEGFRALQLEWQFSKDEILQLYLNLIPYGGNIEGVKSAAVLYFGKLPNQLSLAEITALTIIPNRPTSLALGKNNATLKKARNQWLKQFQKDQIFATTNIQDALQEPLEAQRITTPNAIPHLGHRLHKIYREKENLQVSIKKNLQNKLTNLVYNYSQRLKNQQIYNAAVLVVNNKTLAVEAYVGSSDFEDLAHAGQVDGVIAIRSPGSTLKPLVYAMAFDAGNITPKTIIEDIPTDFAGYAPTNFDKKFNGNVSAEKALIQSLNIPAVKVLAQVGNEKFIKKLEEAQFKQVIKDKKKLGYSLILGGCGVTLEELVMLFASYANQGKYAPPNYLKKDTILNMKALISPAAAYIITEILSQATRPDLPNAYQNAYRLPKIAWKTGTSYGRRDAWSVGYNADYTVGIWLGNFSGEGIPELIGAESATPLLFEIFNTISYNAPTRWFFPPADLKFRSVCTETGLIANDFCESQVLDYYLPLISVTQKCQHLKEIYVNADETFSYCVSCQPEQGYKKKTYPNLSASLINFYENEQMAYTKIPPHNPACQRVFENIAPIITSPIHEREYIVDRNETTGLMLSCDVHNEVKKVYWYIDDKFHKEATPHEKVFFIPTQGEIKISCSDDKGRNTDIKIKVLYE